MKKLITIMASMATCLLFGAGPDFTVSGTSFEGYGERTFDPAKDDAGVEASNRYWYNKDSNALFVLTNYDGVTSASTPAGVPRPDYFAASNNTTFLSIDTDTRLYRSAKVNGQDGEFESVAIPANGIYLDTLVKFTPAEDETGLVLEGTDKIAIAYVEHEDLETPANSYTNFVVCAGYLGAPVVTNYYRAYPSNDVNMVNFKKDDWHRLTVRSFNSIDTAGHVGFVIYLDNFPLQYDIAVSAGDNFEATGAAAAFYSGTSHALFPSAVQSGEYKNSIAAVAFTGNGSVDDVTFTTDTPNFIKAGEAVRTEITLGTGVSGVTVTVGVNTINPEDAAANPLVFNLPAGTTNFVLGVTADTLNGYSFDETTGITSLTDATYATADDTVTITGASPALTVKGTRSNVTYIDGEDQQQSSPSLATAFANAKAGSTITLAYSVDVADIEGSAFETYDITSGKDLVLDLNGKTITWNDDQGEQALFTVRSGASFRVIDSSVANTGAIVYTGEYVVFYNKGDCYIGATTGDKGPTIQGKLAANKAEAQIVRGKFDKAANGALEFTWVCYIEEGSELVESLGDYWVVAPEGGSDTPVAVPGALLGIIYDGSLKTGVVEQVGFTLSGNTATDVGSYEAIATLQPGYVWSDDNTKTNKTIPWAIGYNNKATVVLTLASEIAEWTDVLDFPEVTAKVGIEDVTGTPVWDPAKIGEPNAGETNIYTVTFTVMNGGYTGSTGLATFKVWKAASGGYPSYIPTGDAEVKAKYDAWATKYGADTTSAHEDAFLLNCAPADVDTEKAAFKLNITIVGDTVTVTGPDGKTYNGTVQLKGSNDLSTWTNVESASKSYQFFKAVLAL